MLGFPNKGHRSRRQSLMMEVIFLVVNKRSSFHEKKLATLWAPPLITRKLAFGGNFIIFYLLHFGNWDLGAVSFISSGWNLKQLNTIIISVC